MIGMTGTGRERSHANATYARLRLASSATLLTRPACWPARSTRLAHQRCRRRPRGHAELLRAFDIRDRNDDYLKLHVDWRHLRVSGVVIADYIRRTCHLLFLLCVYLIQKPDLLMRASQTLKPPLQTR